MIPIVSVIMANYNGAKHLRVALESVLAQSISQIELLLCDDGSTDDSIAIAREIAASDPRLKILKSVTNQGAAAARNRALDTAVGEWISIVDADDIIHPERFARMLAAAERLGANAIADNQKFLGGPGSAGSQTLLGPRAHEFKQVTPELLIQSDINCDGMLPLGYLKPMFRRSSLGHIRYSENMSIGEDFELYLRYLLNSGPIHLIPESYYIYRRHSQSLSFRLSQKDVMGIIYAQAHLLETQPDISPALAALFVRRAKHLQKSLNFERFVGAIKSRNPAATLTQFVQHPSVLLPLARATKEHFLKDWQKAEKSESSEYPCGPIDAVSFLSTDQSDSGPPKDARGTSRIRRSGKQALTHIRTPTYKRPEHLRRCLEALQKQTNGNWICDVFDDDPNGSARLVVLAASDPRITHIQNTKQKFASCNIDQCFTRDNPHCADYFCVVEDDNYILPTFIDDNIRACETEGVEIVFRNQLIEFASGTDRAYLSDFGILDKKLAEGRFYPENFRLSLLADIGVSNGGLFWSRNAQTDLEIGFDCSATLQEYLRTFSIAEPIYVAMEPLAVWAENGERTTRDLGLGAGYLRRELNLKRSIALLQKAAWRRGKREDKSNFLENTLFAYSKEARARGLVKSHIRLNVGTALPFREKIWLFYRGALIRILGRPEAGVKPFILERTQ